jgi:hypothetical protein
MRALCVAFASNYYSLRGEAEGKTVLESYFSTLINLFNGEWGGHRQVYDTHKCVTAAEANVFQTLMDGLAQAEAYAEEQRSKREDKKKAAIDRSISKLASDGRRKSEMKSPKRKLQKMKSKSKTKSKKSRSSSDDDESDDEERRSKPKPKVMKPSPKRVKKPTKPVEPYHDPLEDSADSSDEKADSSNNNSDKKNGQQGMKAPRLNVKLNGVSNTHPSSNSSEEDHRKQLLRDIDDHLTNLLVDETTNRDNPGIFEVNMALVGHMRSKKYLEDVIERVGSRAHQAHREIYSTLSFESLRFLHCIVIRFNLRKRRYVAEKKIKSYGSRSLDSLRGVKVSPAVTADIEKAVALRDELKRREDEVEREYRATLPQAYEESDSSSSDEDEE